MFAIKTWAKHDQCFWVKIIHWKTTIMHVAWIGDDVPIEPFVEPCNHRTLYSWYKYLYSWDPLGIWKFWTASRQVNKSFVSPPDQFWTSVQTFPAIWLEDFRWEAWKASWYTFRRFPPTRSFSPSQRLALAADLKGSNLAKTKLVFEIDKPSALYTSLLKAASAMYPYRTQIESR